MAVKRKKKTGARTGRRSKKSTKVESARKTKTKASPRSARTTPSRRTKTRQAKKGAPARTRSPRVTARNATAEDLAFIRQHAAALSRTTKSAKWIHSPDEHEDRPGQSLATRNHDVIRRWAEERGAVPATVEGSRPEGRAGVLRFNFPGYDSGGGLREIGWEDWFRTFDERSLVFLFQEHKRGGQQSNFFQLDSPYRETG